MEARVASYFFQAVARRYEHGLIISTSNTPFADVQNGRRGHWVTQGKIKKSIASGPLAADKKWRRRSGAPGNS